MKREQSVVLIQQHLIIISVSLLIIIENLQQVQKSCRRSKTAKNTLNQGFDHFRTPLEHFQTLFDTFGKSYFLEAEDTYDIGDFEGVFNL